MKRSRETEILRTEDNKIVGIWMKADFTAEHEWGIADIYSLFEVNTNLLGVKKRTIRSAKPARLLHGKKADYLIGIETWRTDESLLTWLEKTTELHSSYKPDDINSIWSGEGFCVVAKNEQDKQILQEIYQAFQKKDVALWIGGGGDNPFDSGGLVVAIKSRMSQESIKNMLEHDKNEKNLKSSSKRLGIEDKIKVCKHADGYKVFPYWTNQKIGFTQRDGKGIEERTKHKVVYWLRGRDLYDYFTVEEINEWLKNNTGIIADEIKQNIEKRVNEARAKLRT